MENCSDKNPNAAGLPEKWAAKKIAEEEIRMGEREGLPGEE